MKEISIILPVCSEAENLGILCEKIDEVMRQTNRSYEMIFVEGGSQDNSFEVLADLKKQFEDLKIVRLKRKYGQSMALAIGMYFSGGEKIIAMDSDLQNDPGDIPKILEKLDGSFDIVCGWRRRRNDPYISKVLVSKLGNKVLAFLTGCHIHDFCCTFKAFNKAAAKDIGRKMKPGYHRFIPYIGKKMGYSFCEIEVNHLPRIHGKSKYKVFKLIAALFDYTKLFFVKDLKDNLDREGVSNYIAETDF